MSKYKGKKRKNEEYDLQTIMEDDDTSDVNVEAAVPQASGRDAEKSDEAVNYFIKFRK